MELIPRILLLLTTIICFETNSGAEQSSITASHAWTYKCENNKCLKTDASDEVVSLDVCQLTCSHGTLWPYPTGNVSISKDIAPVDHESISFKVISASNSQTGVPETIEELVRKAGEVFKERLMGWTRVRSPGPAKPLNVVTDIEDLSKTALTLDTNESYSLSVDASKDTINVIIKANNFFGARHGLETLSQLIVFDSASNNYVIPNSVSITDKPKYQYRGLLLDTARNYISLPNIKRTIDAMSTNKLNSFHWHLTDSHSFPFISKSFPMLSHYGAYSENQVYSEDEVRSVVEFGRVRGVRVVPELDAPAHVGEGWQWVGDNATVCFGAEPWTEYCVEPPCGQLNPTSEAMYTVLEGIYKDMMAAFQPDMFHFGGDEVNINCWNTSQAVTNNLEKLNLTRSDADFHKLWSYFQSRAYDLLRKNKGPENVVIWTSSLTKDHIEEYLDKSKYIIQIWTKGNDKEIADIVKKGYRVIFSNYDALYFDCGFGAWVGIGNNWCSPYIGWQKVYENDPEKLLKHLGVEKEEVESLVLGAEAALWTEQVDDSSLSNRLWPRGSAHGERMWGVKGDWQSAEHRLLYHRERMVRLGFTPDTLQPQWCIQNQGHCYI